MVKFGEHGECLALYHGVMTAVAIVTTSFFTAIIGMQQAIGMSSPVSSLSDSLDSSDGSLDSSDGSLDSSDGYAES